jgi:hypothetical protein
MSSRRLDAVLAEWGMTRVQLGQMFGRSQRTAMSWSSKGVNDPAVAMLLHVMAYLKLLPGELEELLRRQAGASS